MSKDTFEKLAPEKRETFIRLALEEFAQQDFQSASISNLVKRMGIAKGSIYQYFNDKLDLYLYLKRHCEAIKLRYVYGVRREDFPDFWAYFRALFIHGIPFDLEHPLESQFLYRIGTKESSPQVRGFLDEWKAQGKAMFRQLVQYEQSQGHLRQDMDIEVIVHFLITASMSIADLLQSKYQLNFDQNLAEGKPLFGGNAAELEAAVSDLIAVLRHGLGTT